MLFGAVAFAQTLPVADQPVVITLEGDNYVIYRGNTFDATKIAKDPNPTTSAQECFPDLRQRRGRQDDQRQNCQRPVYVPRSGGDASAPIPNPASRSPIWIRAA